MELGKKLWSKKPSRRPGEISFARLIVLSITAKFTIDTGIQIFNPFLGSFAAGLGVDVVLMGRLVSLVSAMGILAPFLGVLADRMSYRLVMRLVLLSGAMGTLLVGVSNHIWIAVVGLVLMGIGVGAFAPLVHAYVSALTPYQRRARGIGMVEYSWALANIVGLSLMGQLIDRTNWRAPFFVLSAGMALAWIAYGSLPAIPPAQRPQPRAAGPHTQDWCRQIRNYFDLGPNARSAWGAILAPALNFFASFHIVIVFGVWLDQEYGLGPAKIGMVALLMGLADLCGSVLVSLVGDRVGKRRGVLFGTAASLIVYVSLPFLNTSLLTAVLSLILLRFAFEFSMVSSLPLLSEQVPDQRGKVLALSAVFFMASSAFTGFTGPWAYTRFGVWGLGPVSAMLVTGSLVVLWRSVKEIQISA